jgi:NADH-quinone oxidoreductase subunit M
MLPYLSLAIWVPIVAGVLVLAVKRDRDAPAARWLALVGAVASFAVTIPLYTKCKIGTSEMQFVEAVEWIPRFNVNYLLGRWHLRALHPSQRLRHAVCDLGRMGGDREAVAQYMAAFLIMSGLINGVSLRSTACCSTLFRGG